MENHEAVVNVVLSSYFRRYTTARGMVMSHKSRRTKQQLTYSAELQPEVYILVHGASMKEEVRKPADGVECMSSDKSVSRANPLHWHRADLWLRIAVTKERAQDPALPSCACNTIEGS